MVETRPSISDERLHAYVDGRLHEDDVATMEAELANNPELAARVHAWKAQNEGLQTLYDPVAEEPVPSRLDDAAGQRRGVSYATTMRATGAIAAALLLMAIGAIGGWFARDAMAPAGAFPQSLAQAATAAHIVYVAEPRHAVEVGAEEEHLFRWLSARLGGDATAPPLGEMGFQLVGGRLLPFEDGHAAQYMYEDEAGRRLTLYLTRNRGDRPTNFRWEREGEVGAFYWVEGDFGYALIGALPREDLLRAARIAYGAFLG